LRLRHEFLSITRDQVITELSQRGIGTSVHFIPLHLHPFYQREFGYKAGDFPAAEAEYFRAISLPIFPAMTEEHVQTVIQAVMEITTKFKR
jgi:perosamine synthetase